jgi:hypothetical protein
MSNTDGVLHGTSGVKSWYFLSHSAGAGKKGSCSRESLQSLMIFRRECVESTIHRLQWLSMSAPLAQYAASPLFAMLTLHDFSALLYAEIVEQWSGDEEDPELPSSTFPSRCAKEACM